ncbi:MAG: adenosylcobinamide-GDP ribazoletransferase [Spirochaetales bacterium]|nr:adenosylcobinamide-GDP ribazoletransferase [Spirochaetales bacterium]
MKSFFASLRFLTIIPMPDFLCGREKELRQSTWFFPLAGALIGMIVFCLAVFVFIPFLPHPLPPLLIVITLAIISGGLHLDGLADTADGCLSVKGREKILKIMKDSRIGTMGTLALLFTLSLKTGALYACFLEQDASILMLGAVLSRSAFLIHMYVLPAARTRTGLGRFFKPSASAFKFWEGVILSIAAGGLLLGINGLLVAAASLLITFLFSFYCFRKIGGFTGDTLGALSELIETFSFLVYAILQYGVHWDVILA